MADVYFFSPDNYEYLSTQTGFVDPLDPPNVIVPANATLDVPPSPGANQVARYDGGVGPWSLVDDFRGTTYWIGREEFEITEIDVPIPGGSTPTETLANQKLDKIDLLRYQFNTEIYKNITVSAVTYFCDPGFVQQFFGMDNDDAALATKPTKMFLPNNTVVTASRAQLKAIHEAWSLRVNQSHNNYETKLNAINAAPDEATLDAIDLTTGWPA